MSKKQPLEIYGPRTSPKAYAIRDFLYRSDIPFLWVELKSDEEARAKAGASGLRDSRLPVVLFPDGTRMEDATLRQISDKLGWFRDPSRQEYDLVILGAGPAGLSAAVYGASEGLKTLVIERLVVGGQAGSSSKIENYLGFPEGISGMDLAKRARDQASRFGAEILQLREGVRAEFHPGKGIGYLADGTKVVMHAGICASGVQYRRLGLPNEDQFLGAGIYYGAGASEAALCVGDHVFVVGGGNSAGQAAMHFSRYAAKVTMLIRGSGLKETVSQYLVDRIMASPRIEILTHREVIELHGDEVLRAITVINNQTGDREMFETSWVFLCLGGVPHTEWAAEAGIIRDQEQYLVTGPDLKKFGLTREKWPLDREPYYLETSQPGLFAAGDVRHGSVKRCAAAVGDGAMAVTFAYRYLSNH
ncbi:MAG TPA: FAD-dependent oxidoreductase [Acidobacteriaceae bacterium]|nr:FAD-dependent oxidoreductase [Acidobacteriaceae bacterium]